MKHSPKPKFQCPLCSKTFVHSISYKRHMEIHTYGKVKSSFQKEHHNKENSERGVRQDITLEQDQIELEIEESIGEIVQIDEANTIEMEEHEEEVTAGEATDSSEKQYIQQEKLVIKEGNPAKRKKMYNFEVDAPNGMFI